MSGHSTRENREILGIPIKRSTVGRTVGEGESPKAHMNVPGKSDIGVVPTKSSNKPAQLAGAETMEGRPVTKGNLIQTTVTGTQCSDQARCGLDRVRQV